MEKYNRNKFENYLCEPQIFSCWTIVIMAEWNTPETFFDIVNQSIKEYELEWIEDIFIDKEDFIKNVKEDWVHFHIDWSDFDFDWPAWYLGWKWKKWSKKVLTYY
jgi:hypothetical protein